MSEKMTAATRRKRRFVARVMTGPDLTQRSRFMVNPDLLMDGFLPPGNVLTGVAVTSNGMLVFEYCGVDVQPNKIMMLIGHRAANGQSDYTLELSDHQLPTKPYRRKRAARATTLPSTPQQ